MKEIKRLDDTYFNEITELSEYAFQYKLTEDELEKKRKERDDHSIFGWLTDDKVAGKVHIIPLETYVNGEVFKMGGIASVASWPEYRRQGIIKHLLHHSLKDMKKNGQLLSFLSPFSFSFYRKYGWELTFTNQSYSIPIANLKQNWHADGYVRRVEADLSKLYKIYTSYAKKFTGMNARDENWWQTKILTGSEQIAFSYNDQDEPEGYLIYHVKNNVFSVKDFAYSTLNGWKLLLEFIANHDSMVGKVDLVVPENDLLPVLLENPKFDQRTNNFFMARIVDVQAFFEHFPFAAMNKTVESLTISVVDEFFEENSAVYQLAGNNNIEIKQVDQVESDIKCSIQMLTMMFLGYKRPLELYKIGHIQGDEKAIKQLDKLIPVQQTFLPPVDGF